jgi:hypothetical protein
LALLFLVVAVAAGSRNNAKAEDKPRPHMTLGVVTHFSQGWKFSWIARAADAGATAIRDEEPWNAIEWSKGEYGYSSQLGAYPQFLPNHGMKMLLVFMPYNSLYDGGNTVQTTEGQLAFARFIVAQLDEFPEQVSAIEIGNEINGEGGMPGISPEKKAQVYTSILRTVYQMVKERHSNVAVLGGSTNAIATGFLEQLFQVGALSFMDGVVVHPYRDTAEHVDDELLHLTDVMKKYGNAKPIYVTEFGSEFDNSNDVPPFMLKMVTLMASAGVNSAYWYALSDEKWFRNMGLFEWTGAPKPASDTFSLIQDKLLAGGNPVRVHSDIPRTFIFRYGANSYVMWGADRKVVFTGHPVFHDSQGKTIAMPNRLSDVPFIVSGDFQYQLEDSVILADSMLDYGENGPWRYFARTSDGTLHPLKLIDWEWTSYIGDLNFRPLEISSNGVIPGGVEGNTITAVERITLNESGTIAINGSWNVNPKSQDGIDLHIYRNGTEVFGRIVTGAFELPTLRLDVQAGDHLDFAVGPNRDSAGDSARTRIQISKYVPR